MRKLFVALVAAAVLSVTVTAAAAAVVPGNACGTTGAAGIANAETHGGNVTCTPG